jgi:hypothetical protein
MICFNLFYIELSYFNDSGHGFGWLNQVEMSYLFLVIFLIDIFFNFIFQH